jgi:hypothetical protein
MMTEELAVVSWLSSVGCRQKRKLQEACFKPQAKQPRNIGRGRAVGTRLMALEFYGKRLPVLNEVLDI